MSENNTPAPSSGFDMNKPTIISLLYLASWITGGLTGIAGIVLAHVWQDGAADWEKSHYTYLIRTFWFSLLGSVISFVLLFVIIGFVTMLLVAVWMVVRSILSLVNAQKQKPMPDPETLGF